LRPDSSLLLTGLTLQGLGLKLVMSVVDSHCSATASPVSSLLSDHHSSILYLNNYHPIITHAVDCGLINQSYTD